MSKQEDKSIIQYLSGLENERLVFGKNPVLELLTHRLELLESIFVQQGSKRLEELKGFEKQLEAAGLKLEIVEKSELEALCAGGVHQGVAAVVKAASLLSLKELSVRLQNWQQETGAASLPLVVLLDEVQDPQNFGSILRAAAGSGAFAVVFTEKRCSPLSAAARKASAGASEILQLCRVKNLRQAMQELKKNGYWLLGTALGGGAECLYEASIPTPSAIVLGSEAKGLRPLTAKECDMLIEIPMEGQLQSLNVGQAAAVVLFELLRRQRTA